jgi:hypothetical protein
MTFGRGQLDTLSGHEKFVRIGFWHKIGEAYIQTAGIAGECHNLPSVMFAVVTIHRSARKLKQVKFYGDDRCRFGVGGIFLKTRQNAALSKMREDGVK